MERDQIIKTVSELLLGGTSVSILGFSGVGREDFLIKFEENISDNAILVKIDTGNTVSVDGLEFHRLAHYEIAKALNKLNIEADNPETESAFALHQSNRENITRILKSQDLPIIFQISDLSRFYQLDESFFNSVAGLRRIDRQKISFMFVDKLRLLSRMKASATGELHELIHSRFFFIPLPNRKEFESVIQYSEKVFGFRPTEEQITQIYKLTHGHYGISHYLINYIKQNGRIDERKKNYLADPAIELRIKKSVDELGLTQKDILTKLATAKNLTKYEKESAEFLRDATLLDQKYKINIPILKEYLLNQLSEADFVAEDTSLTNRADTVRIDGGVVMLNGKALQNEVTSREFQILSNFLENAGKVVSRDTLANIIWGEMNSEKYSDWAIDQAISRLRRKLHDDPVKPRFIKTIKGRGFKFIG